MSRLDWIPNKLKPPPQLFDTQRDWWRNIVDAMFENDLMQGYLPKRTNFYQVACPRSRAFWEAHCATVIACFDHVEIESKEVITYRPLLDLISTQREKLRGPRRAREHPSNSISQSVFDFEVQKQGSGKSVREVCPEKRPPKSAKVLEREARDRQTRVIEAQRRGLA